MRSRREKMHLGGFAVASLAALAVLFSPEPLRSAPASPHDFTIRQPDGTVFRARHLGDEWANVTVLASRLPVVQNPKTRFWEYARLKPGEGLVPSGAVVGRHKPRDIRPVMLAELPRDARRRPGGYRLKKQAAFNHTGTYKLLLLLVEFSDRKLTTAEADWQKLIFGDTDSVAHYYKEVSYGQLAFSPAEESSGTPNDGVVKITLTSTHPNPGSNVGESNQKLTKDALIAADGMVDFASFDTSGDGQLLNNELIVLVVAAGFERAFSGESPSLWAHQWCLFAPQDPPTLDGVKVSGCGATAAMPGGYTQVGELHKDRQATIGVIVHELGHGLGLPDLYDTDGSSSGIGRWDTMATGAWNQVSKPGDKPAHFSAWTKAMLGWVTPTQITQPITGLSLPQVTTASGPNHGVFQFLDNPDGPEMGGSGEYFLVENRQKAGYDAALPGAGLLIWHVDETRSNNNDETRKLVDLEQAKGTQDLDSLASEGDANDPFYAENNGTFNDTSNPNSKLYNGEPSKVALTNISSSSSTMTADVSVGITLPSAPPNLNAQAGDAQVDLAWEASSPGSLELAGYNVYRATTTGGPYAKVNAAVVTSTSFADTGLTNGTTYYYVVRAVDSGGNESEASNEAEATPFTAPTVPTDLAAMPGDAKVDLAWSASSKGTFELAGYNVYRATTTGGPYAKVNAAVVTSTSFADTGLTNGTTYYYVVRAVDSGGNESADSQEVSATPSQSPLPPEDVTAAAGDQQISLSWTAPAVTTFSIAGYNVYRATTTGGPYTKINETTVTATGYTDKGLTNGVAYFYVVRTLDSQGQESADSQQVSATPTAGAINPPSAPASVTASATDAQVELSWQASEQGSFEIAGYHVYRATTTGGPYTKVNTAVVTSTSFADTGLTNGTTYYYVVRAVDSEGNESLNSTEVSAVPFLPPGAPSGLTATVAENLVTLTWTASEKETFEIAGYHVYRRKATEEAFTLLNGTAIVGTTYEDDSVASLTTYVYVVEAVDEKGNRSARSPEVTAAPGKRVAITLSAGVHLLAMPLKDWAFELDSEALIEDMAYYDGAKYLLKSQGWDGKLTGSQGFWVKTSAGTLAALGESVDAKNVAVALNKGWTPLGVPWETDLPMSNLTVSCDGAVKSLEQASKAGWTGEFAWGWEDGAFALVHRNLAGVSNTLSPYKGYFFYSFREGCVLSIATSKAKVASQAQPDLPVLAVAVAGASAKGRLYLGLTEGESLDIVAPPSLAPAPATIAGGAGVSLRPISQATWEIAVFEAADLTFELAPDQGAEVIWTVRDTQGGKRLYVSNGSRLRLAGPTRLSVTATSLRSTALRPRLLDVFTFPNPTGAGVTLNYTLADESGLKLGAWAVEALEVELFTPRGKRLFHERPPAPPAGGRYRSPRLDAAVLRLPNGVYFYRLRVRLVSGEEVSRIGKMMVLR